MVARVIDIQHQMRELGRIRMGAAKTATTIGKKLTTFRLTSKDKHAIQVAAEKYGGTPEEWTNPSDGSRQWQVITAHEEIPVLLSPVAATQAYELWSGGGCQRRCDGCTQTTGEACVCDPDPKKRSELARAKKPTNCKLVTRLAFMIPGVPDLGVWRLDTGGFYAATELPLISDLLSAASRKGNYVPAFLAIEIRTVKRGGQTKKFPVPVIRLRQSLSDVPAFANVQAAALDMGASALTQDAESLTSGFDEPYDGPTVQDVPFVPDEHAEELGI